MVFRIRRRSIRDCFVCIRRQGLIWWRRTTSTTFTIRMQKHTTFFYAFRPERKSVIPTVCATRADSIIWNPLGRWRHYFRMPKRRLKTLIKSPRDVMLKLSLVIINCRTLMCRRERLLKATCENSAKRGFINVIQRSRQSSWKSG